MYQLSTVARLDADKLEEFECEVRPLKRVLVTVCLVPMSCPCGMLTMGYRYVNWCLKWSIHFFFFFGGVHNALSCSGPQWGLSYKLADSFTCPGTLT